MSLPARRLESPTPETAPPEAVPTSPVRHRKHTPASEGSGVRPVPEPDRRFGPMDAAPSPALGWFVGERVDFDAVCARCAPRIPVHGFEDLFEQMPELPSSPDPEPRPAVLRGLDGPRLAVLTAGALLGLLLGLL